MVTTDQNIFREAKALLDRKTGPEMTDDELELVATAIIPLLRLPQYSDVTIADGLEAIARLVEEARRE